MYKFGILLLIFAPFVEEKRFLSIAQCMDEQDKPVDFFYAYKLPRIKTLQLDGYDYVYITSDSLVDGWKNSTNSLKDDKNLIARTLRASMSKNDIILVAYNDEEPNGTNDDTLGHTKGVFASDGNLGSWLVHSVPKFPDIKSYNYPANALHYGQSFLCISINSSDVDKIGEQFLFNEVNIYHSQIPEKLNGKFPKLEDAIKKKWRKEGPFQSLKDLRSLNGTKFISFAKGRNFQKELYADWVAPELGIDLLSETWRNGPGALPSNCSLSHKVFNIKAIEFKSNSVKFKSTVDHSKWVVGRKDPWVCVGDINRAEHQEVRGGGTVCLQNKQLAEHYRQLVGNYESCSNWF